VLGVHRAENHQQEFNVLFAHVDAKVYIAAHPRVDSFGYCIDQFSLGRFAGAWLESDILVFERPHLPVQDLLEVWYRGVLELRHVVLVEDNSVVQVILIVDDGLEGLFASFQGRVGAFLRYVHASNLL
jgi:hypothetical protein